MKKRTHSRREFVGLTGTGIAGLAGVPWLGSTASAAQAQPAASNAQQTTANNVGIDEALCPSLADASGFTLAMESSAHLVLWPNPYTLTF
jgi:hypothetical protein